MGWLNRIRGGDKKQPAKRQDAPRGTGSDKVIPSEEVDAFLDAGEPLFVQSSTIAMAQYHVADEKLMIEFLSGEAWLYSPVSRALAESFANAPSKGTWLFDHIRVRGEGNQHAHQVSAVKLR
jgi:KTSC domain